jgi:hypothetical protein
LFRSVIDEFPDGAGRWKGESPSYLQGRFAMNIGIIATFVVVLAGLVFMLYALIRPFTHIHHDHNDVFHPPHLD